MTKQEVYIKTDFRDPTGNPTVYAFLPEIGQGTCWANCEHCFLRKIQNWQTSVEILELFLAIQKDVENELDIQILPPDNLSLKYLKRLVNLRMDKWSVYTIEWETFAWTSWAPIWGELGQDWRINKKAKTILDTWRQIWYTSIIMNGHGIFGTPTPPLKWNVKTETIQRATDNILARNKENKDKIPYKLWYTCTLRDENYKRTSIKQVIQKSLEKWATILRFNSFINTKSEKDQLYKKYEKITLTKEQTKIFYQNLKETLDELKIKNQGRFPLEISISQDIGSIWSEIIIDYIKPKYRGNYAQCDAGETLFALVLEGDIPSLHACVNGFKPKVAEILKVNGVYKVFRTKMLKDNFSNKESRDQFNQFKGQLVKDVYRKIISEDPWKNWCMNRENDISPRLKQFIEATSLSRYKL